MLRVGLTGSIAVGKSFVAATLAELGCHVLDADVVARQVVEPGSPALREVVEKFGPDILEPAGTLDRAKLGALVFANPDERKRLESILHPHIIAEQDRQLREWEAADPAGIGVIDAALMIESGGYKRLDKIVVVHCDEEVQIQRLMARDGISREAAEKRIAAQMPQDEKKKYADFLIDTSRGFADTRTQTEAVFEQLQAIESNS